MTSLIVPSVVNGMAKRTDKRGRDDLQARTADLILGILNTAEGSRAIEEMARREGATRNQVLAAAIAQAVWELLDRDVFGTE